MSGKLLYVYASSRPSRIKRLTSNFPISIRGYCEASNKINNKENNGHGASAMEERAPSTAEEFIRVAEEKAHHIDDKGLASQTSDKATDAAGEVVNTATRGESVEFDHVKESYKEAHDEYFGTSDRDYRRKGDKEEPTLPKSI